MTVLKSTPETADMLGVQQNTLEGWRCQGRGPAFVRIGRRIMYRVEDIEAFISKNVRTSTSDVGAAA